MLKRLLGILFTLAALATFVWVGMGSYTSWCFAGEEVVVEEILPAPVNTVSADAADPADAEPAVSDAPAAPADSLSSPAADSVRQNL